MPALGAFLTNNFVRGAISGLGVLNLVAALGELADVFGNRGRPDELAGEQGADTLSHH